MSSTGEKVFSPERMRTNGVAPEALKATGLLNNAQGNFDLEISAARVGVIRLLTGTPDN